MNKLLTLIGLSAIVAGLMTSPAQAGIHIALGFGGYYSPVPAPYPYGPAYYEGYFGPEVVYYGPGYYPWFHGYWRGGYHHRWYYHHYYY
jgi:hypothetical protein